MKDRKGGTRLNICMLLPVPRYGEDMRACPQTGICSYLTNFGHQVSWVIWSDGKQQVQPFLFNDATVYVTPEIHYLPASFPTGKTLNRILNAVKRIRYILRIFKQGNCNLIFVRSDVFDGLIAAYVKRRHKVPFVFELSSPLEQAWEIHKIEAGKPRVLYYLSDKFTRFLANRLLREADLVLPTSKWLKEHLVEQGIPQAKMMPYPNGVDIQAFSDKDGKGIRQEYGLGGTKVITYIGTLGKGRSLELLIRTFSLVRRKKEDVKLLIVGEGSDEANLKRLASELGIEGDVVFTGQVPQANVPSFIAASDIGVSPVPPFFFYKLSSPIKMFEYMAMAKPVVANDEIPEHKEVLEQSGGGILVPFATGAFASAIIELLDNPERAAQMGQKGREWVLKNRTYEILARRVEEAYYQLLNRK